MKIYLVGGAVRNQLLGLPVKDKDWVVVGGSAALLLSQGYIQVGREFPVFLHPETKEEYALARLERKCGRGYHGFSVEYGSEVTLEEDLKRRDLTVNAIAMDENGQYIDPCGGINDLNQRILRHVSPAFIEDPVRVLRVARFLAQFYSLSFRIAPETITLMKRMTHQGELNYLVPERVWHEFDKALHTEYPDVFLSALSDCNALDILFPEFKQCKDFKKNQRMVHDTPMIRFARLCLGLEEIALAALSKRLKIPKSYVELARLSLKQYDMIRSLNQCAVVQIIDCFEAVDLLRRPERFDALLRVFEGEPAIDRLIPEWRALALLYRSIEITPLEQTLGSGRMIKDALRQRREAAIQAHRTING